jgi:hypothetical protein
MITRRTGFKHQATSATAGDAALPPPLCFTVPAGQAVNAAAPQRGGAQMFAPAKPKLMMDPSDPSTWQRPYEFPA